MATGNIGQDLTLFRACQIVRQFQSKVFKRMNVTNDFFNRRLFQNWISYTNNVSKIRNIPKTSLKKNISPKLCKNIIGLHKDLFVKLSVVRFCWRSIGVVRLKNQVKDRDRFFTIVYNDVFHMQDQRKKM